MLILTWKAKEWQVLLKGPKDSYEELAPFLKKAGALNWTTFNHRLNKWHQRWLILSSEPVFPWNWTQGLLIRERERKNFDIKIPKYYIWTEEGMWNVQKNQLSAAADFPSLATAESAAECLNERFRFHTGKLNLMWPLDRIYGKNSAAADRIIAFPNAHGPMEMTN